VATATTTIVSINTFLKAVKFGLAGCSWVGDQLAKRGEEVLMSPRHYQKHQRSLGLDSGMAMHGFRFPTVAYRIIP
jgi:hypothetical protein